MSNPPSHSVWRALNRAVSEWGAAYVTLIDPDRHPPARLGEMAAAVSEAGADAILVGNSVSLRSDFADRVAAIHAGASVPVLLFPAHAGQVVGDVDAVLFMSLLSGRNPQYLIVEQMRAAPVVKSLGLEVIPTGYLLVESGRATAVEFVSDTRPLPRDKPEIAVAHALAAECLGMRLVYLEAGSGSALPVPEGMVRAVAEACALPVMVGGGIVTPEAASRAVRAGASFVVTGNVLEEGTAGERARVFVEAVHSARAGVRILEGGSA